jgi:hypothetical protein
MKLAKLFGASALFASMIAATQAGTIVTVKVKNSTTTEAAYTYEYFSGSVSPTPGSVLPSNMATFSGQSDHQGDKLEHDWRRLSHQLFLS